MTVATRISKLTCMGVLGGGYSGVVFVLFCCWHIFRMAMPLQFLYKINSYMEYAINLVFLFLIN